MKIVNTYSFKGGEKFLKVKHPKELREIQDAIKAIDATLCLTKESKEKTKKGQVLFSPVDMNNYLKLICYQKGWTTKAEEGKKKKFIEPRHKFTEGRSLEMDGVKNKVGLEIQFGKYAFMVYDILSKMVIFKNLGYINCGIEIVPSKELVRFMSTGVSYFEQLLIDLKNRGEANLDIPVFIISIGLTDEEKTKCQTLRELFRTNRKEAITKIKLRKYNGSAPGPK